MEKRAFGKAIPIAPETVAFGATSSTGYAAADAKAGWAVMVSPEVRWRIVMMIVVNICITIGYYGFASCSRYRARLIKSAHPIMAL